MEKFLGVGAKQHPVTFAMGMSWWSWSRSNSLNRALDQRNRKGLYSSFHPHLPSFLSLVKHPKGKTPKAMGVLFGYESTEILVKKPIYI
jgi:hypothetical protein